MFYLKVHKIHQFCDLGFKDFHSFLINFNSIRLLVALHLSIKKLRVRFSQAEAGMSQPRKRCKMGRPDRAWDRSGRKG